jgi:hypothetical protein
MGATMNRIGMRKDKGVGLIVLIIVMAFLLTVGVLLIFVTGTGPQVAGNVRLQDQAFNAAEAGFDDAWVAVEDFFVAAGWTSFDTHYLTIPAGIDLPVDPGYFRRLTDEELLNALDQDGDGNADDMNVIFYKVPYVLSPSGGFDPRYTYTAFLVDDEAGNVTSDPSDALLVCIGAVQQGNFLTTSRLEIELAIQLPGTTP